MTDRTFHTALVTGIGGSGGSDPADYIIEQQPGVAVHGIARWHSTSSTGNLPAPASAQPCMNAT